MTSSRRQHARETLGIAEEMEADNRAMQQEEERRERQAAKKAALETDGDYLLVKGIATAMDGYFLDPVIGFFIPGFGDLLSSVMTLPYYYVSLFKIKSIPLTLAIMFNMLVDMLVGAVPFVGDLIDVFHRSYRKNYRLIVGFVEDDAEIVDKVKKNAFKMFILILVTGYAVYWLISTSVAVGNSLWQWVRGLF
jgi:hypothetical protein